MSDSDGLSASGVPDAIAPVAIPSDAVPAAVIRALAGEATDDDRRELEQWLAAGPERRARLAELQWLWDTAAALPAQARVDRMWRGLARRMRVGEAVPLHTSPASPTAAPTLQAPADEPAPDAATPRPPLRLVRTAEMRVPTPAPAPARRPTRWTWRVAAGLAVVAAGAGTWPALLRPWRTTEQTATTAEAALEFERDVVTPRARRTHLELPDGSRIDVGAGSVLHVRYVRGGERLAYLEGEAFFEVAHDERRPFVVHSAHGVVEDLGTSFAVRAFPGDTVVQVAVLSGAVSFGTTATVGWGGDRAVLRAGQAARLDRRGRLETLSGPAAAAPLGWVTGRVTFRQATLREVVEEVARWQGVQIAVPDSALARRRVTLDMPAGSVDDILGAAAAPLGARVRRTPQGAWEIVAPPIGGRGRGDPARGDGPAGRR